MRKPLKTDCFGILRSIGMPVESVIDVGVLSGTPELMLAFRDRRQYLIEPIVEWTDRITAAYGGAGVDYRLINVAASDSDGTMNLELSTIIPGLPITHARLTDKTEGANLREVPVRRLDSLAREGGWQGPFLLKIDVDGAELKVLEGARGILPDCSVIMIEAQVRNIVERMNAVAAYGFELFDIVDPCYYTDRLAQVDLVFANREIVAKAGLELYRNGFKAEHWTNFQ